jgi:hypothetical protein
MLMQAKQGRLRSEEDGFAALVIAIVLVLVLSLITVGFAELMRKEEKSALDKHLSSQAFYAAEAGINDAAKAINAGFTGNKTDCAPLKSADTCLLIDQAPLSLEYSAIDNVQSKVVLLSSLNKTDPTVAANLDRLHISWEMANNAGGWDFVSDGKHDFTPGASWGYTGVIRITLTPLTNGSISRAELIDKTYTAFLYPTADINKDDPSTTADDYPVYHYADSKGNSGGAIIDGHCNTENAPDYDCNVTIDNLTQNNYLITIRSIYSNSKVRITGHDTDSNYVRFGHSQFLVDSTGKAQDVLRRVQVRIPSTNEYPHTDYGLQSNKSICKQLQLTPTSAETGNATECPLP